MNGAGALMVQHDVPLDVHVQWIQSGIVLGLDNGFGYSYSVIGDTMALSGALSIFVHRSGTKGRYLSFPQQPEWLVH